MSVGHGLIGQWVRVCGEDEGGVKIYYADHPVRRLQPAQLATDCVV